MCHFHSEDIGTDSFRGTFKLPGTESESNVSFDRLLNPQLMIMLTTYVQRMK